MTHSSTHTPLIGIVMGSDSDLPIMQEAAKALEEFGIAFELTVVSAHRTPERLFEYGRNAQARGLKAIIAGAGGAAHLPGMLASLTTIPVIGVPVKGKNLEGMDSLLSIVQMPPGIPVATVAINGAKNAGILAASIVGTSDAEVEKKVRALKDGLGKQVLDKAEKLEAEGYSQYLTGMGK